MSHSATERRRAVVALGGNALLRRREPLEAANQARAARDAARIVVDADDPAFRSPSKFIGRVYTDAEAGEAADRHGWTVARDGHAWRRVVPSPEPRRIVQLGAIERLVDAGFILVCAGGGVPVVEDEDGRHRGVEAVIDKDLASSLLAIDLGADALVLATDVDAVYDDDLPIARATPEGLRTRQYPAGSMGPKVEAACRFVERTGETAAIGSLDEIEEILDGRAGTRVSAAGPTLEYDGGRRARVA
jgi:carbamate kinase